MYAAAAPVPGVNSPQQALVRVDTVSGRMAAWHAGVHAYVGEPILVPKAQRRVDGACSTQVLGSGILHLNNPTPGFLVNFACLRGHARAGSQGAAPCRRCALNPCQACMSAWTCLCWSEKNAQGHGGGAS